MQVTKHAYIRSPTRSEELGTLPHKGPSTSYYRTFGGLVMGLLGASLWDFGGPLYGTFGGLFMGLWGASLSTEDQK